MTNPVITLLPVLAVICVSLEMTRTAVVFGAVAVLLHTYAT